MKVSMAVFAVMCSAGIFFSLVQYAKRDTAGTGEILP
jgi:hypothetical protein